VDVASAARRQSLIGMDALDGNAIAGWLFEYSRRSLRRTCRTSRSRPRLPIRGPNPRGFPVTSGAAMQKVEGFESLQPSPGTAYLNV
jgi:hypothetical protein